MKRIFEFFFGKAATGEKMVTPAPPPEREFDATAFYQWCQEFRVSCLANKGSVAYMG
jgi:hypothetical protein